MDITELLVLLSGIAWTIAYLALLWRGFRDKSFGMPLIPLALNFAWEITYSLIYPPPAGGAAQIVNGIWLILDIGIILTFLLFGYKYYKETFRISKPIFYIITLLAFAFSFAIMIVGGPFFAEQRPYFNGEIFDAAKFIAFIQNAVISVAFVVMFWMRRSSDGQSFTIAWSKWIGTTLTVGVLYTFIEHPQDWMFIGIFLLIILIFDMWYMVLIYNQLRGEGINPWVRI